MTFVLEYQGKHGLKSPADMYWKVDNKSKTISRTPRFEKCQESLLEFLTLQWNLVARRLLYQQEMEVHSESAGDQRSNWARKARHQCWHLAWQERSRVSRAQVRSAFVGFLICPLGSQWLYFRLLSLSESYQFMAKATYRFSDNSDYEPYATSMALMLLSSYKSSSKLFSALVQWRRENHET